MFVMSVTDLRHSVGTLEFCNIIECHVVIGDCMISPIAADRPMQAQPPIYVKRVYKSSKPTKISSDLNETQQACRQSEDLHEV